MEVESSSLLHNAAVVQSNTVMLLSIENPGSLMVLGFEVTFAPGPESFGNVLPCAPEGLHCHDSGGCRESVSPGMWLIQTEKGASVSL